MPHLPSPVRLSRRSSQRGLSVISLIIVAIIIGFFALLAMRVFPSVNEYLTIRKVVTTIMKSGAATPADVRKAFDKAKEIEYSITSLDSKDLVITQNGERLTTRFAYNVEVPIVEPVYLLIKYDGEASSSGS
jgi:hypothetical protein